MQMAAKRQKHKLCETKAFPPLLLVGGQESVLQAPKRGQFHAVIRVTPKCCDSCAQGALGRRALSRRNFSDAESLAERYSETCHSALRQVTQCVQIHQLCLYICFALSPLWCSEYDPLN